MSGTRVFVGGLSLPVQGSRGRVNIPAPLGSLTIDDAEVTLRAVGLIRPIRIPLGAVSVGYRLRGRVLYSGVGLRTASGGTLFFITWRAQERVLAALAAHGVTVDPVPHRAAVLADPELSPRGWHRPPRPAPGEGAGTGWWPMLVYVPLWLLLTPVFIGAEAGLGGPYPVGVQVWVAVVWGALLLLIYRRVRSFRTPARRPSG